jgi:RHS repeat-associated protein
MTDASGTFTYAYTHTRTGRLDHVTGGHGDSPGYDYDRELAQPADRDRAPGLGRPHASIQTAYNYDGDGLRTAVVRGTGSGASTEHYTWDVAGALTELIGDGAKLYLYGPSATPLAQIDTTSGAVDYLHHDINATTRVLTDDTGTVEATASYDPYGSPTTHTGTAGTAFGYAGEYTDPDTGLVYLRARYYDPTTAQFLTRDPLEAETGAPYSYAGSDPLDASDPSGLDWCVGSVCLGFHPSDAIRPIVNIGRGASFGLSDKIANWISPGASCTVDQNAGYQALGSAATLVATFGFGGAAGEGAGGASDGVPGLKPGWQGRAADNGKGWVWQEPGAPGNANSMRVMDPTPDYPNGYVRYNNGEGNGQPIDLSGKPGPNSATHIPRNGPGGDWPIPMGW